jgi:predicted aldo/keto reductase-like oxidoreductase
MKTDPIRSYNWLKEWLQRARTAKGNELTEDDRKNLARFEKKVENSQEFIKRYNLKGDQEIRAAAIKFCLSDPRVNTVCLTVLNFEQARDYLKLSGSGLETKDASILAAYKDDCGGLYCRHACGLCEASCPHRVPVNTIMRYDHYFVAQGREKHAMAEYAALTSTKADICQNCSGYCESACPYGLPVQALLSAAHQTLSLGSPEP